MHNFLGVDGLIFYPFLFVSRPSHHKELCQKSCSLFKGVGTRRIRNVASFERPCHDLERSFLFYDIYF